MVGIDEKRSSRDKSSHKKRSSSSSAKKTSSLSHRREPDKKKVSSHDPRKPSSSHKISSSRETRDTDPYTAQDGYKEEDDDKDYYEEEHQEDYSVVAETGHGEAADTKQRTYATTSSYSYDQPEQDTLSDQTQQPYYAQTDPPGESGYSQSGQFRYDQQTALGSTGPQKRAAHDWHTEETQYSAQQAYSNSAQSFPVRTRETSQPSEPLSRYGPATGNPYQYAPAAPSQQQQPFSYSPASYAQTTTTQQAPVQEREPRRSVPTEAFSTRPAATEQPYSYSPVENIQRTLETTNLAGAPTSQRPAAATVQPFYPSTTSTYGQSGQQRSSYPLQGSHPEASDSAGPDSGTADTRTRRWQSLGSSLQHRSAESWEKAPKEKKTINDSVNRMLEQDDDTGS